MKVIVEILTGRFFYIEIEEDATVEKLRREIAAVEKFEGDRLVLVLDNGKLLEDEKQVLAEHGVGDGSVVYLHFASNVEDLDQHTEVEDCMFSIL